MNRKVDIEQFREFVSSYQTKKKCAEEIGISRSHLDGLLTGKVAMGDKTQKKIISIVGNFEKLEELLLPEKITLGKKQVEEIIIKRKLDGEVIFSLTSRDLIVHKDFEVMCVPHGGLS